MLRDLDIIGTNNIFNKKINYMHNAEIQLGFTKVFKILRIFLTTLISTASYERSFSCLRYLKTDLRTTMG